MEALKVRDRVDSWNDDRLDELSGRVQADFIRVEGQVKEGFAKVDARFAKVDARFAKVDERFDRVEGQVKEGFADVERRAEARMDRLESSLEKLQYWIWGIGATLLIGVITHFA